MPPCHSQLPRSCGGAFCTAYGRVTPLPLRCRRCNRYEGGDKVAAVMREVDQVKGVMSENINQAMSNLESAEDLNNKTDEMKQASSAFNKQAKTAKNQMWWKNMKVRC